MNNFYKIGLALTAIFAISSLKAQSATHQVFFASALESRDLKTVNLPLYRGVAHGVPFWYVITESSSLRDATLRRVNYSPKLALAKDTAAVQKARFVAGILTVAATVDFSPQRKVVAGADVFPPLEFAAGSVGEIGYSPLVQLPNGTILNASHVTNASGTHDRVVRLEMARGRVVLASSVGFFSGNQVWYTSLDASAELPAALEGVTLAPSLALLETDARSGIAIVVNGQTGAANPNRQGLVSALKAEGDPRNVLESAPDNTDSENNYSPMWNGFMTVWNAKPTLQTDFDEVALLGEQKAVTAPDGHQWQASGFVINCPVISISR